MKTCIEFLKNEAHEDEGLADAGIETFREAPYASCAKEAGQNSADAKLSKPVKMSFKLLDVDVKDLTFSDQLKESIDACLQRVPKRGEEKEVDFFGNAQAVLAKDTVKVLEIADENTTGLVGPAEEGRPFYALLKSSGVSNKQESATSSGSFGIGKNATFAISDLQTVLYSTRYVDEQSGDEQFLAQGKIKLVSHVDSKREARKATGWWGLEGFREISDPELVPTWMRRSTLGTSLFSIGFRAEENWQYKVAAALLRTFFVAIHDGEMVFDVNGELQINRETIYGHFNESRFLEAAEASHAREDFEFAKFLYECLISEESVEKIVDVRDAGNTSFGKASIRILKKDGMPKRVGIVRNGMMITDNLKHFDHPFRTFPMCADFVALVRPYEDSGSSILKKIENPSHDSFSSKRITDPQKQNEAFRSVKNLGQLIREAIKSETRSEPRNVEALSELAEFFADDKQKNEEGDGDPTLEKFKYKVKRKKKKQPKRGLGKGKKGGGGTGPSGGGGGGKGGAGPGNRKGTHGAEREFAFSDVRYIHAGDSRQVAFTPEETGKVRVRLDALGLNYSDQLSVQKCSVGQIRGGDVHLDVSSLDRVHLEIEFVENYEGPIELSAFLTEEPT